MKTATNFTVFILFMFAYLHKNMAYDFRGRFFCSTCFANNQDQNYRCCFYLFKCCAEARRSSSPNVRPNAVPIPSQQRNGQPCLSICKDSHRLSRLCCSTQTPQTNLATTFNPLNIPVRTRVIKLEDFVKDETQKNFTEPGHGLTTGQNLNNPSNSYSLDWDSFLPPSLALDLVSGDESEESRKHGIYTKDLLMSADEK